MRSQFLLTKEVSYDRFVLFTSLTETTLGRQDVGNSIVLAGPAVAEKGSFNLRMEVATPGGHSSVPPPHTVRDR